ncbi:TlpA family protein disulfide reductase [Natrononativus amylolyticus]|uniref:TlpA family protein disulfide reductase n=1 Tax=Natrononativus amylolyticus TaxID=2963434 RepID=UPI0020CE245D|nr:TlpA disulfide reductase family protein [Natrononativus amylolyticus]
MRRRELVAGVASLGVFGSGGYLAVRGVPADLLEADGTESGEPERMTVETIEATGSDAGELEVPVPDRPTFIDFFATWCQPCIQQMPALAAAHDRLGNEVRFLSVTNESIPDESIAEWWDEHDGNWTVGLDPALELAERYSFSGYPTAVAIDAGGEVQWSDSGVKTEDELVAGIEQALER